jgi:hypothetical protein
MDGYRERACGLFSMISKSLLILAAIVSLTMANYAHGQELQPAQTQLQWNGWDIEITDIKLETAAAGDSESFILGLIVTNLSHEGRSFSPPNDCKLIIGEDAFDAFVPEIGDYYGNIEPKLSKVRACIFEIPKVLVKDLFVIRFQGSSQSFDLPVSIVLPPTPAPTPVPTPMPTPTKEQLAEAKACWENERIKKANEVKKAHERFLKQKAVREANGDFSQSPGLTPEQKEEAEIKWAEENAAESIKGATPAPQ